jgi:group I intron endonuclease
VLIDYTMNAQTNINAPTVNAFTPLGVIDKPFIGGALYIMSMVGVYKIQSKIKPFRLYIGSSVNVKIRWQDHRYKLGKQKHSSIILQNHVNKYGIKDLEFKLITSCEKSELIEQEQYFIDLYNPYFNVVKKIGSHNIDTSKSIGQKIAESNRNRPKVIGRKLSEETRAKIGAANRGHKASPETKRLMSEQRIGNRYGTFSKGIKRPPFTEERKAKLSASKKGKKPPPFSEEHKRRISIAQLGKTRITKKSVSVLNTKTGEIYPSITRAAIACGINKMWLINRIDGRAKNYSEFIRYNSK